MPTLSNSSSQIRNPSYLLSPTSDVSQLISKQTLTRCTLSLLWSFSATSLSRTPVWSWRLPLSDRLVIWKLTGILTLLWPSMACRIRSLITRGVAVAAVIALRCRESERTQTPKKRWQETCRHSQNGRKNLPGSENHVFRCFESSFQIKASRFEQSQNEIKRRSR